MSEFEHKESTWVYDYSSQTAELYTTCRRLWLRAITRNPNFIEAVDLKPGYRITWPLSEVRPAEMVADKAPGGKEAVQRYLTPQEVEARKNAGLRLTRSKPSL